MSGPPAASSMKPNPRAANHVFNLPVGITSFLVVALAEPNAGIGGDVDGRHALVTTRVGLFKTMPADVLGPITRLPDAKVYLSTEPVLPAAATCEAATFSTIQHNPRTAVVYDSMKRISLNL